MCCRHPGVGEAGAFIQHGATAVPAGQHRAAPGADPGHSRARGGPGGAGRGAGGLVAAAAAAAAARADALREAAAAGITPI